jgi:hypothetical protein
MYLSPRSWVILDKPIIVQPLKKFPRFITEFKRPCYWSLLTPRIIQSTSSRSVSLRSVLMNREALTAVAFHKGFAAF